MQGTGRAAGKEVANLGRLPKHVPAARDSNHVSDDCGTTIDHCSVHYVACSNTDNTYRRRGLAAPDLIECCNFACARHKLFIVNRAAPASTFLITTHHDIVASSYKD